MAIRREDRTPIVEIMQQTPEIPDNCQWAIFLRNHDELTLEMVTDEDRDYMYNEYAKDPRMRINLGIRRRLAPLMDNGRRRIELMHAFLFTLPGTPVMYYGDEIGMGDNIYLGDRNGVRTPMQWTWDRNAGFSTADSARLYAPPIQDPVYGYQALNVEQQQRTLSSLYAWVKRMLHLRKRYPGFSLGKLEFHNSPNRKVLCYTRTHQDQTLLMVCNLSRFAQPAELPLQQYEGLTPIELLGETAFPVVRAQPYQMTLGPYGFYWFRLEKVKVQKS
jgi:maltose alpha-D-glucosyltransferase / alpha-amylase